MNTTSDNPATQPMTGKEYLESLRDGREVWIYGQKVDDITEHLAFRNSSRMIARLYDALHDEKHQAVLTAQNDSGTGVTHRFFKTPYNSADLIACRDSIALWQKMVNGWMGRTPDYKASFLVGLGVNPDWFAPYHENARRWYDLAQKKVLYFHHGIVHPPIDRNLPPDEVSDINVHVERETDEGLVVSGAKMVGTGAALTNYIFMGHTGAALKRKEFALLFVVPMRAKGLKLLCRPSYEFMAHRTGSPFDYPLSSRFDENDSAILLDKVMIPWENVLIYGDLKKASSWAYTTGFTPRAAFHASIRLATKLDFIVGMLLKATDAAGTSEFRGVQVQMGEVMAWRNLFWALGDAMAHSPTAWHKGSVLPNANYAFTYRVLASIASPRVKELIEQTVASGLIYVNSHATDWQNDELRPYLDQYLRGSKGYSALARVKLMKLLWDAVGTEFGGRHELYERNFSGSYDDVRSQTLHMAASNGETLRLRKVVEEFMGEYDLDGWHAPDLAPNPEFLVDA